MILFFKAVDFKKGFLLSIIMLASSLVFSAEIKKWNKLDSPEVILKRYINQGDTTDLKYTLDYLNQHFLASKTNVLFGLIEKASLKSEKSNRIYLFDFYNYVRQHYNNTGNTAKSLEYALNAYHLEKGSRNSEDFIWTMVDIGNIFFQENDFQQSVVFYQRAEELAFKRKDYYALSVIYLNYGLVNDRLFKYETAISFYKKSCVFRQKAGNEKFLANNYINIASTLLKLKKMEEALKYIHLAEQYYYYKGEESYLLNETPFLIAFAYADFYFLQENYPLADSYLLKAREIAEYANFKSEYFKTYFKEAEFLMGRGKHKEAIKCLNIVLPLLLKEQSLDDVKMAYKYLAKSYSKVKNIRLAEQAFDNYIKVNDLINHSNLTSQLNTLRAITAVHDTESKLQMVKKNLEITKIKNELQAKQRKVFLVIFAFAFLVIAVLLILVVNLRKNKVTLQQLHFQSLIQNNEIKVKSIELQRSDQIKDKLFSIIAHDLRNPLNRLLVELAIVKKAIGGTITEPMENTLKETIGLFERLLQWSKMDNKQNVYSPTKLNLSDTINKVISFYLPEMQLRNITFINNSETYFVFVDPNILQTLLRNFLSNAISALPNSGTVEIEVFPLPEEKIELVISDSGKGFPDDVLNNFEIEKNEINSSDSGLGLTLCKVLAKMSGWTIKIANNSKYSGACVSIVLPIFREKKKATELNVISRAFEPDDFWKEKLEPMVNFKFYQTSQIRSFLKTLGDVDEPQVRLWIRQIEKSVHQGDQDTFLALIELIK